MIDIDIDIDTDIDLNWVDDEDRNIAKVDGAATRFKARGRCHCRASRLLVLGPHRRDQRAVDLLPTDRLARGRHPRRARHRRLLTLTPKSPRGRIGGPGDARRPRRTRVIAPPGAFGTKRPWVRIPPPRLSA